MFHEQQFNSAGRQHLRKWRGVLLAVVILLIALFMWRKWPDGSRVPHHPPQATVKETIQDDQTATQVTTAETIMAYLRMGDFARAERLLHRMPENPAKIRLLTTFNASLHVDVRFQYQKDPEPPSPIYPLTAPQLADLVLTHMDNYRLFVSVPQKGTYLYIFQKDRYGQITRLFPDPVWSKTDNPIDAGVTYRIPPGDKEWLYLDQLPPDRESAVEETLYLVASPWQAEDLESLYGDLHRVTSQTRRQALLEQFLARLELRAIPSLRAVYHQVFSFNHEG